MTRGKLVLVTQPNGSCLVSPEFNGDMYLDHNGNGAKAFKMLSECKSTEQFFDIVLDFLKDYNYIDEYYNQEKLDKHEYVRISNIVEDNFSYSTYFEKWFSDYVYVLNLSGEDIQTKVRSENSDNDIDGILRNGKVEVLCFGRLLSDNDIKKELQ